MRAKNIHQVQHDFWKETPKAKQMLLRLSIAQKLW